MFSRAATTSVSEVVQLLINAWFNAKRHSSGFSYYGHELAFTGVLRDTLLTFEVNH